MADSESDAEVLALLLTYFEHTADFVGVSDPWGRVLYLNPAAQKRLGVIEFGDLNLADLFPAETFAVYYDVIRPALLQSGSWSGEILVNVAGRDAVPMRVSTVARIGPGGEVDGSVMIGHEPHSSPPTAADVHDAEPNGPVSIGAFRVAMSHGEVVPYAEPVVDLRSRLVMGYRGFARWNHRGLGQLEAKEFIATISTTSSAAGLDLYVARDVAAMLLLTARSVALRMYTPASLALIGDVHTEQHLVEIADAFFLPLHQVHLQVARTLVAEVSSPASDSLRALAAAGVGFVLTGTEDPSDVGFAADHAFREVHLSRGLTQAAANDDDAVRVVSEIAERAHRHRMLVAATGVTDRRHEQVLLRAGCDLGSGALYGEPEPAAETEEPATFRDRG